MRYGWIVSATLLAVAVGCRSTPAPAYQNKEGRPLADEPALPYCIAVAPLDRRTARPNPAARAETGSEDEADARERKRKLTYSLTDDEFQSLFVQKMKSLQAASDVRIVGARSREEAEALGADLLITPRLAVEPHIGEGRRLGSRWATMGLWITTWVGALRVKDTRYDLRVELEFDIRHLAVARPLATRKVSTTHADLSYRERNRGEKSRWAQTAVVPPFWARSSAEATSRVLSEVMVERTAGWLTRYLKDDFAVVERQRLGDLRLASPRNGAVVDGGPTRLEGEIVADEPITELVVLVNTTDPEQAHVALGAEELPDAEADQQRGGRYHIELADVVPELPLDAAARNEVRLRFRIGIEGSWSTRTLVFPGRRTVPAKKEDRR